MVCYHPISAWQYEKCKPNGKKAIVFSQPNDLSKWKFVPIPCGQCVGCRLDYSRQWAVRCVHESRLHDKNCFITLTYDDDHVPWSSLTGEQTLVKKHHQDFLKRLRKRFADEKIRFFLCGEYGELTHRPHYHAILFGFDFPDKQLKYFSNGCRYYTSDILDSVWKMGNTLISDVNFDTCAYVARYIMKKVKGEDAVRYYDGIEKDYVCMSRRPGIAHDWFEQYSDDIYPHDEVIMYRKGKAVKMKPPRYYDNLYDLENPELLSAIKERRLEKGKRHEHELWTPGRMEAKEKVKLAQISRLERIVE